MYYKNGGNKNEENDELVEKQWGIYLCSLINWLHCLIPCKIHYFGNYARRVNAYLFYVEIYLPNNYYSVTGN